jgi:hypothetical protein
MPLFRVLVGVLVLGVAFGAAALDDPCVIEDGLRVCPYDGVGAFGDNNIGDFDFSRCNTTTGCVDYLGNPCPTDDQCILKAVPVGRCSAGSNTPCIWPNGAGFCTGSVNSFFGCLTDSDCPTGDTCFTDTIDPACACENSDDPNRGVSVVCGGQQARCSDGDNPDGAFGTGLCIDLVLGDESDFSNCGEEAAGEGNLSGPRWQVENPGAPQTPQRVPGAGFLTATGPIFQLRGLFAMGITDPDAYGVRRLLQLGDSFHSDWNYSDKAPTDGIVNSHIITFSFDSKVGWQTELPVDGRCTLNTDTVCIKDVDCPGTDTCNPQTFVYGHESAITAPFFLWTRDISDPNDPSIPRSFDKDGDGDLDPDCPPVCGLNYALNSFEEEQIRVVGGAARDLTDPLLTPIPGDPDAGIQLSLNTLVDGPAGEGDVVGVNQIVSLTWLPAVDMRCFIGGAPDRGKFCEEDFLCEGGVDAGATCSAHADCGGVASGVRSCVGGTDNGLACELDNQCRAGGICPKCLAKDCTLDTDCSTGTCADTRIGRCQLSEDACDPFSEFNQFNRSGSRDDCRPSGVDDADLIPCKFCGGPLFDTDAPDNTCRLFPDFKCRFSGDSCFNDAECPQFNQVPGTRTNGLPAIDSNTEALPIGYNDHGLAALGIRGRIHGVNGQDVKVRVPLFIVGTTGSVVLEFRDNDTFGTIDRNGLGPVSGGARGLGVGGTFADDPSTVFPAFGYDPSRGCCQTAEVISPGLLRIPGRRRGRSLSPLAGARARIEFRAASATTTRPTSRSASSPSGTPVLPGVRAARAAIPARMTFSSRRRSAG